MPTLDADMSLVRVTGGRPGQAYRPAGRAAASRAPSRLDQGRREAPAGSLTSYPQLKET